MLEYQKQNCELTLREGINIYHSSFPDGKEIYKDKSEKKIWRYHDATHVIFGMDVYNCEFVKFLKYLFLMFF